MYEEYEKYQDEWGRLFENKQHVFIIGCKGVPAHYGGFETFVDKLLEYHVDERVRYHVACAMEPEEYTKRKMLGTYRGFRTVTFPWRKVGPARAILYDLEALGYFISYARFRMADHPIFYVLACRIGPFAWYYRRVIEKLGGELYVNPDGHEFLRAKWSRPVRRYWKLSERLMVKNAHRIICDSKEIEHYIHTEYAKYHPKTEYISYGTKTSRSTLPDDDPGVVGWYREKGIVPGQYYLVVGRFVPENNYETMIREFMKSHTDKKFVLITGVTDDFLKQLEERTGWPKDPRICFAGTVYEEELLRKIRENAYAYLHGHEVGGTNPSLLEALGSTKLNLLLDVGFNREVGEDAAKYWTKEPGNLASLIDECEQMTDGERDALGDQARERMKKHYSWEGISAQYERMFLDVLRETQEKEEKTNVGHIWP